ncbi:MULTISPECIES: hypothetical protein [unclassified Microbulbifer]|uniref:hypothetical protein n=1 Tax=unclassified Microbulbifer TaxID=2619833 RepID=UPI0027E4157C|nr:MULTISPECIES: hypothetical protein [unclassified Microbulbifer]
MSSEAEQLSIQAIQGITSPPGETDILAPPELHLRAPRSVRWEVFLFLSTLGLYFSVYLFRLARELRTITGKPLSPWLWIFVPFVLLAQIFAFPKLLRLIEQVESENSVPDTWGDWSPLWVIVMCATTLVFNISEKFAVPDWLIPAALAVACILFAVFHNRVNRIRRCYKGRASFDGKENGFSATEWVTTIVLFPIATALMALVLFYSELFGGDVIEELDSGQIFHHQDYPFSISVPEDGWSLVDVGSHSDGTAVIELEGPLVDMYYVVFYHGPGSSVDDITSFRTKEAISEIGDADCTAERTFLDNSLNISSRIQCKGKYFGDPNIVISKTIETKNGLYELYGNFSATEMTYRNNLETFLAMEKGFGAR